MHTFPDMARFIMLLVLSFTIGACGSKQTKESKETKTSTTEASPEQNEDQGFSGYLPSMATITTYDGERRLEEGFGFFVGENLIIALNSQFGNCNRALLQTWDGGEDEIDGFLAVDRINNLVLLKTKTISRPPLKLYSGPVPTGAITYLVSQLRANLIPVNKGKVLQELTVSGIKAYSISNQINNGTQGRPVFLNNKEVLGVAIVRTVQISRETLAIPATYIAQLLEKKNAPLQKLALLSGKVDPAVSKANAQVKGVLIETEFGSITMRLFNDTPEYRDNFLKLTREHYYDSLLWHRVIPGFVVQSGAADTRHAEADDMVGWKGPGYTLPANIHPKYFHRRGIVGVPRLPDDQNQYKRSDGSQFYIVTGRIYTDSELNDIEKEKKFRFTEEQRQAYKTIGGAPTLDHEYSIFGEITEGMDIADRINALEVNSDFRPKKDIRVLSIRVME
jgi:peptidyl-prolyl cis-trans isomerase A (cyclophilin A)